MTPEDLAKTLDGASVMCLLEGRDGWVDGLDPELTELARAWGRVIVTFDSDAIAVRIRIHPEGEDYEFVG